MVDNDSLILECPNCGETLYNPYYSPSQKADRISKDDAEHLLGNFSGCISGSRTAELRNTILNSPKDAKSLLVKLIFEMKQPITTVLLALFFGAFGADMFYINEKGKGVGKLIILFVAVSMWIIGLCLLCLGINLIVACICLGFGCAASLALEIFNLYNVFTDFAETQKYNCDLILEKCNHICAFEKKKLAGVKRVKNTTKQSVGKPNEVKQGAGIDYNIKKV